MERTNQDLETAYEELQSTNEELETMNEELQSTNEELQTINDELRQRSDDLNAANTFLEAILASLGGGVAVVDRELRVLEWNRHAEDLWGLRTEEARGQHLLNLDIGLPVAELRPALRGCLTGEIDHAEVVLPAVNRWGKSIQCHVSCPPGRHGAGHPRRDPPTRSSYAILLRDPPNGRRHRRAPAAAAGLATTFP